jgi:FAD:protein FMN transferase
VNQHRFDAMGCEVVVGGAGPAEARQIEHLFRERDHTFSRFRPDSELNRVNGRAGRLTEVSSMFAQTVEIALRIAAETEGLVDPTLGQAVEAAGYSQDFGLLTPDPRPPGTPQVATWRAVLLLGRRIRIPGGTSLDLNGVVKALAVDDAVDLLPGEGFVSAGGDVATRGELTVALPDGESVLLRQGALATSGTTKRRWLRGGELQHHLIDPRTGRPSTSRWEQVTVCGGTCLAADAAAKAGFLLGEAGPGWLDERGLAARFLGSSTDATLNDSWQRNLEAVPACT